MMQKY